MSKPIQWSLASLSLSALLSALGTSSANVGLPAIAQAFSATFQQAQWIVIAYLLAVTTLVVSVGRLGDVVGRKRLLLAGILLFTASSVLCGLAPSLRSLIASRAAQGIGAAIMMALTMAFIGDTVPKEKTGSAMGLLGSMSAVGTALGPSLGGFLIGASGWRAIFLVNVPLGILALALAYRHLPPDRARAKAAAGSSWSIPLGLLRDRALRAGLAMSALVSTVMMATLVVGPFYLAAALGLGAAVAGLVMSAGPVAVALAGVPAGQLADRFGAHRVTQAGLATMAAGALALSLLPATLGIPGYIVPLVVITVGYAIFQTANNTSVMKDVAASQRGVFSGLLNLSRNLGLVAGASVMGLVFTIASGTNDIATASADAVATGMRGTFAAAAMLILVALVIATRRRSL